MELELHHRYRQSVRTRSFSCNATVTQFLDYLRDLTNQRIAASPGGKMPTYREDSNRYFYLERVFHVYKTITKRLLVEYSASSWATPDESDRQLEPGILLDLMPLGNDKVKVSAMCGHKAFLQEFETLLEPIGELCLDADSRHVNAVDDVKNQDSESPKEQLLDNSGRPSMKCYDWAFEQLQKPDVKRRDVLFQCYEMYKAENPKESELTLVTFTERFNSAINSRLRKLREN